MSLWKKAEKSQPPMNKAARTSKSGPNVEHVTPRAAIPGGEIAVSGSGLTEDGRARPQVRIGDRVGSLLLSSPSRLIVRVPEGVVSGDLVVDTGSSVSAPVSVAVGVTIADNLHPVANPTLDAAGNVYTTFSGSRGQKVPVSVYKISRERVVHPFLTELMNPTGLAIDHEGYLYISSRMEGNIYRASPDGQRSVYAEGMGVATGIAFDEDENLYVGDRTGTVFKINRNRQIFVFTTLEPSVAAYHLAFGSNRDLYMTGPTTSSFDHVLRVSPSGEVRSFYRGLGRPQGLAFDVEGNLYVAASLAGKRGVVRLTPDAKAELVVSGYNIVGLAFTRQGSMILATNSSLVELPMGIEGKPLLK
jgi:sugar lactone lactonase YvrE